MTMTKYVLMVMLVLLLGCNQDSNQAVTRTLQVDDGLSLEYDKSKGSIVFRTEDENRSLNYEFRKFRRELNVADGDTLKLDKTGLYSFIDAAEESRIDIDYQDHEGVPLVYNYNTPSPPYGESETTFLNDAILGSNNEKDGNWIGWKNQDVTLNIEFPAFTTLSGVKFRYKDDLEKDIYPPASYSLYGSTRHKENILLAQKTVQAAGYPITVEEAPLLGQYKSLKLVINHYKRPDSESWLVLDEVILTQY